MYGLIASGTLDRQGVSTLTLKWQMCGFESSLTLGQFGVFSVPTSGPQLVHHRL